MSFYTVYSPMNGFEGAFTTIQLAYRYAQYLIGIFGRVIEIREEHSVAVARVSNIIHRELRFAPFLYPVEVVNKYGN